MDRWTEIALFVRTAELGSLSRAAEAMSLSNAAASRHLASLEARLGVSLVQRNTRRLSLTEMGESYFGRCKVILAELRDADSEVNASALNPMGTLGVTASLTPQPAASFMYTLNAGSSNWMMSTPSACSASASWLRSSAKAKASWRRSP